MKHWKFIEGAKLMPERFDNIGKDMGLCRIHGIAWLRPDGQNAKNGQNRDSGACAVTV
jgi:hypothetical protein